MGFVVGDCYGLTETTGPANFNFAFRRANGSMYYAGPLLGNEIQIHNPDKHGVGEIWVRGNKVMPGYLENDVANAEAFEDGWFKTGDIGYMDKENYIFITGRKKNVIIASNGKNVFPEELEEYLGVSEWINEIVVIGRKGEEPGEVVITALVYPEYDKFEGKTKEEIQAVIEEVVDGVNKKLPTFKHIKQVEIRETEFEKNTSRKIMRYKIQ
jgi:long-chain acyl-CoA synthetase